MPLDEQYVLALDGRPVQRGLSQSQAFRLAERYQRDMDTKISGTRRRTGGFEVKRDAQAIQESDAMYRALKRHTFIVRP